MKEESVWWDMSQQPLRLRYNMTDRQGDLPVLTGLNGDGPLLLFFLKFTETT